MSDTAGWCLIESDPGVFTELIRELGVNGAQVEELWTLDSSLFETIKPIHGLIFLFRWIGEDQPDGPIVKDSRIEKIFFAQQDEATKQAEMSNIRVQIADEEDKMKRYKIENARRKHNYLPLIVEILKLLAKDGKLVPLYERAKAKTLEKEKQKVGKT